MFWKVLARPHGRRRVGLLAAMLAVELVDELVDGTKGAALPLMRHDLGLSYAQVGLLFSVPLLVGSAVELPIGVLAGYGRRRRRVILAGGLAFVASVAAAAVTGSFLTLLIAFVAFYPASGAFVGLSEAELMDSGGGREQIMAAWVLAGSAGARRGSQPPSPARLPGGGWPGPDPGPPPAPPGSSRR